jgi:hypothetical protein
LDRLAIDGEDLAELEEVVGLRTAEGAEAELGDDLTDAESGAGGAFGGATGTRAEAGGRKEAALHEGLPGKNSRGVLR